MFLTEFFSELDFCCLAFVLQTNGQVVFLIQKLLLSGTTKSFVDFFPRFSTLEVEIALSLDFH